MPVRLAMPPTASELISAVNHPLRRRILFAYLDGSVECASAKELAEATDQRVGQVAYHLKTLAKGEILRPVRQGGRPQAPGEGYGWSLGVEADWLRLVLEVWAEADVSG
ncbi:MAG TPA: helix-turn-helix domain-containing protein [Solirubrobacterales bacterium]|nr:helix-turn-helix domain-containing protein [Solirubrobacterales bacterium]